VQKVARRRPVHPEVNRVKNARIRQRLRSQPLGSVVIPAHNEALVIRRCLNALFEGFAPGELDVVLVCNGCADDTSAQARSSGHPLRVVELRAASKPAALRAGDVAALAFPRIYLDADVVLSGSAARALIERLRAAGVVAGRPPIRFDSGGASAPVRSYYRARSRVPAVLGSLWGAGVYGLSLEGRRRFGEFPDVVGDDLWVDRLFDHGEVEIVDCEPVVVAVPRRTRDLIRLLRRTYRGKAETASDLDARAPETMPSTLRDLGRLAAAGPGQALDAATYSAFAAGARLALAIAQAGAPLTGARWERDDSSRAA
jgi:glycosyltransferase involved in cell wall biosynthesis